MQQYMSQMRAMFNKHALYSDESPQYQIPFEPEPGRHGEDPVPYPEK